MGAYLSQGSGGTPRKSEWNSVQTKGYRSELLSPSERHKKTKKTPDLARGGSSKDLAQWSNYRIRDFKGTGSSEVVLFGCNRNLCNPHPAAFRTWSGTPLRHSLPSLLFTPPRLSTFILSLSAHLLQSSCRTIRSHHRCPSPRLPLLPFTRRAVPCKYRERCWHQDGPYAMPLCPA